MDLGKSFSIDQSYINLAIIETKELQEKEKKLKQQDEQYTLQQENEQNYVSKQYNDKNPGTYEEIYGTKTPIDVKNIFDKCKDQTKKVLLLGCAGIGKSAFCQYVTYKWAKRELWTQYDLVILIRLRKLTDSRYLSAQSYSPIDLVEREYFPFGDFSNEEKQQLKEHCNHGKVLWILDGYDEFVHNIPDKVADAFNYILTRQHHILTCRPYAIALPYDVQMEVTGFTNDNIEKYIKQFFDQIKDKISNYTFEGQKLLHFLKSNTSIWGIAHIPVNLKLICNLWHDMDWTKNKTLTMTTLYDNITECLCERHLTKQNKILAFNAMEHNDIILPSTLLEKTEQEAKCDLDDHPQLLNFGILKSYNDMPTGSQHPAQQQQAAWEALRAMGEKAATNEVISTLISALRNDYSHFRESGYKALQAIWEKAATNQVISGLINALRNEKQFVRESACKALKAIGEKEPTNEVISTLINALLDEEWSVRQCACVALEAIGEKAATNEVISTLISALRDEEWSVRQSGCTALGAMGEKAVTNEVICSVVNALRDENSHVRHAACRTLGEMGEKAATNEVISTLINVLRDEEWSVRQSGCATLGAMGEKAATNDVISALINALRDQDLNVRHTACQALGAMGEKAATNEVISSLINILRDEEQSVRQSGCATLGAIGKKAATNGVISSLIIALRDQDLNVRHTACQALGAMGEKAATNEVISSLINILRDEQRPAREYACAALVAMGEKAATNELISDLINTLRAEA
ncbi:unnamed protein product, partial [Adineta steineri]